MSFLVSAALAVAALVIVPVLAHLLRRGRTRQQVFPPTSLVSQLQAHSRERTRIQDRALLGLRAAMIVALAVLGATPLVQCSRLSVDRADGASVALALVVDDSHSMRATLSDGETRWNAARAGAHQLLRSLREGDAVALILAGKPARLALSATSDLATVRAALNELQASDRSSDLDNAVRLARSALESLEQPDRRLIVLSDLAGSSLDAPDTAAPLTSLRAPVDDCGIVGALRQGTHLEVTLACSKLASGVRTLSIAGATAETVFADPERISPLTLAPRHGTQSLGFALRADAPEFEVRLTPHDALPDNDRATVSRAGAQLQVAVIADASRARVVTGGATVVEQALLAVRPDAIIRPLGLMPDEDRTLSSYSVVVVDDPRGFGPEPRRTLLKWVESGGIALALLGPASASLQLSSTLEPFAERGARWEASETPFGLDAQSVAWLGTGTAGLQELTRTGRMRLDGAELPGSLVRGRWQDGVPFLLNRPVGSGEVFSAGLPASVDHSDFALRPIFLALLDHLLTTAEARRGPRVTQAGDRWSFPSTQAVSIEGPSGAVPLNREGCQAPSGAAPCQPGLTAVVADRAGRYQINVDGVVQERVVRLDDHEITDEPGQVTAQLATHASGEGPSGGTVDASPEFALILLGLFALELATRLGSEARRRRRAARAL